MKTRIVHIAVVMTLVIGVFCLNTPKAEASGIGRLIRGILIFMSGAKAPVPPQLMPPYPPPGVVRPPLATTPHPLPPPPIRPPTGGGGVPPPAAAAPPTPPKPPDPKPPKPVRPPLPKPNPGVGATRTGRSLLGRLANGGYISKGGKFIAKGLKFYGPIAVISLAADSGHLLANGYNAMERDADRAMAKDMARFEDRYRNPGKYGGGGRFDSGGGMAQAYYNATRPY